MDRKKETPHSFIIVFLMIVIAVVLTWFIPAGAYVRETDKAGIVMIRPESFSKTERTPAGFIEIPRYIVTGFVNNASLILVLLFSGGAFGLIERTGALQGFLQILAGKLKKHRYLFLTGLTVCFALVCSNQAIQVFIPFAPILVMTAMALGFDSITGVAVLILGGGIGFSTGTLRTTTTLIAQNIAQLPPYSGLGYRLFSMACFLALTCPLLCLYGKNVLLHPEMSPMYEADRLRPPLEEPENCRLKPRQAAVLLAMFCFMGIMVWGSIRLGWNIADIAGVFIWLALTVGFLAGMSPNMICREFTRGASGMLPACILTGMGTAISVIFQEAGIIDTIVWWLSGSIAVVPEAFRGALLYLANTLINIFITSGTAQASVVMPIFIPVADMVGLTRQTCVLAYNFGDGFSNYVLPTSSALMGVLGAANVPYGSWMKFMWRIFLVWMILSSVLTTMAAMIQLGPY